MGKTPELFEQQLRAAGTFADNPAMRLPSSTADGQRMVLIYAWNEIGEGGMLIPKKGEGEKSQYLNKVQLVFPSVVPDQAPLTIPDPISPDEQGLAGHGARLASRTMPS